MTVRSAAGARTVVNVALSNAVSPRPRSMRLPMSIMVQPTSCTIDSAATPASVSIPTRVCDCAVASTASASAKESGGSALWASARSTPASTTQVSLDNWSRTPRAASASRSTECTSAPGRSRSMVSAHSVDGAIAIVSS